MDLLKLQNLILAKGGSLVVPGADWISRFERVLGNANIREYLTSCLTENGLAASGLSVKSVESIEAENLGEAAPGMYIHPYGYLVFATSIGGNALCFHADSDGVYWANHGNFYDDGVSYQNAASREWVDEDVSPDAIRHAMVEVAANIEEFLEQFLTDRLESALDKLDCG